jgi:hypothetical protein
MHNLSANELLKVWEQTHNHLPVHQVLGLLTVAFPEYTAEQLARLSIGQRDALLLILREHLFGSQLNSVAVCPQCQQQIELVFSTKDIRVGSIPCEVNDSSDTMMSLTMEDYKVIFRLPNSNDLASIETCTTQEHARERLLQQCIQSVTRVIEGNNKEEILNDINQLPMKLIDVIAERMAEADPQADTRLALTCPDCSHAWSATFDIVPYLMEEIHRWAKHMLREIHNLARAYGWREADILAMSPTRRRAYLELLGLG